MRFTILLALLLFATLAPSGAAQAPGGDGHTDFVTAVAFAPDGKTIVSGSFDRTLKLWDAGTGDLLRTMPVAEEGDGVMAVAYAPDGKSILSGSIEQSLLLWDVASGKLIRSFDGYRCSGGCARIPFSPDGKSIAGANNLAGYVRLWDVATGAVRQSFTLPISDEKLDHRANANHIAFSPDGARLITADHSVVRVWSVVDGRELLHFDLEGAIKVMTLAPDGETLALGVSYEGRRCAVQMWDVSTGKLLRRLPEQYPSDSVTSVAFSPDGKMLAEAHPEPAGGGYVVKVWDAASGKRQRALVGHTDVVSALAFSPDGERLVSGSYDRTLMLWGVKTGERVRCLPRCPVRDQPSKKVKRVAEVRW